MKFSDIYKVLKNPQNINKFYDFKVKGIACDSKEVRPGDIFVAIKGPNLDGHVFIDQAIAKRAKAIIVQSILNLPKELNVNIIKVKDTRKALSDMAAKFYMYPTKKLKIVGITGTNGKTTISYLIEAMLKEAKIKSGVIGTINYHIGGKIISAKNTTPGQLELQKLFKLMSDKKAEYVCLEVSSHALDQRRVEGFEFEAAIFTNLTQDHLDYHATLEDYFNAKAKLFTSLKDKAFAILNNDDKYSRKLKEKTNARIITYGINSSSDCFAKDIVFNPEGAEFTLSLKGKEIKINTKLIGRHNIYNILAAAVFAYSQGIKPELIRSAIKKFNPVSGRLEKIDTGKDFSCFVDYAHTDDALFNVITSLREITKRRIIVVFGCGGERDKGKRTKMGKVATDLADYAIITSDNPRSEDPELIIKDILKGITKDNYCVLVCRKEAIKKSLDFAKSGDVVLVAGKGHERYQIFKEKKIYFDDRKVIKACLN